jgi:ACS family hexuronate transporter-like MFS transporter
MNVKIPHLRWWIAALLTGAAALNYVDRQTLSALAPTIQADLLMDDRAYADVVNFFLVAYTVAYLVSGRIADRMGTRASMVLFVVGWSVANMFTAAAQGVRSLAGFRFALGLGEAGVWPAASKAVSEWFPARERALAIGLYTMGATLGATLAPYLVIPLATHAYADTVPAVARWLGQGAGWRVAFVVTGLAGLVWLLPWLWLYRHPLASRQITPGERRLLEQAAEEERGGGAPGDAAWSWRRVLLFRGTWLLLVARLNTHPVW